jgi:endonuclease/exonuclease/phosphatase (EEP) superfamily protein YafD
MRFTRPASRLPLPLRLLRGALVALGLFATSGTLLSFSKSSHWAVRLWDFPRVQIAAFAGIAGSVFSALFFRRRRAADWAFVFANLACVVWQGIKIFPYTPLARRRVKLQRRAKAKEGCSFRLMISNVLMENREHERLLRVIRQADPDIVLAVETDRRWEGALAPLRADYPHVLARPQNNYYGLMLFSRLRLHRPHVEFLVQHDIPSVHTEFELPSGDRIHLHGLHPRPPEPIRDQKSTPRDAELVMMGRRIREAGGRPTIVAGDLNDVAWSPTTELFLRISGLLDPRMGRGFYNSYDANNPLLRYPLDHVFHSNHFKLIDLRVLPHIGSDHFPVCIELVYEPEARAAQPQHGLDLEDVRDANEKIAAQAEAAATGDDRPGRE